MTLEEAALCAILERVIGLKRVANNHEPAISFDMATGGWFARTAIWGEF